MITFEQAVKRADELGANNGIVTENNNSYIFNVPEEAFGKQPLVILKETGEDLNFPYWVTTPERAVSKYVISHRLTDGKWEKFSDPIMQDEE